MAKKKVRKFAAGGDIPDIYAGTREDIKNAIEMTKLAITEITKLRLGIAAALAASELNAKLIDSTYSRTVNAAISSAQMYATEAAAILGSQNTLVGSMETTARTVAAA